MKKGLPENASGSVFTTTEWGIFRQAARFYRSY